MRRGSRRVPLESRAGQDRRLALLLWAVGLLGGTVTALAAVAVATGPRPVGSALLAVTAATVVCDATCIELRVRRQIESYTWAEIVLVVGLAVLPPEQLVLTAVGLALGHLLTGRSPAKVVFNSASHAVGVALAGAVVAVVGAPSWEDPVRAAVALTGAVAVFTWWNGASVSAAMALSQGLSFRSVYRRGARLRLLVAGGNLVTGLAVLELWHHHPLSLLGLPVVLVALYAGYHAALRVVQERRVWRHLEVTARQISRLDEREIAEVTVPCVAELLDADQVELRLRRDGPAGPIDDVYTGNASGVVPVRAEPADGAPEHPGGLQVRRGDSGSPGDGRQTVVVVPLSGRGRQVGSLQVRFLARLTLSRWELELLQSFASTVAAHVSNARLYAEMREQAARNEAAALHDALTGLPNRALLRRRVEEAVGRPGEATFALLLLDLDHFKEVNDALGHQAGDRLLCEVADRLSAGVRAADTVCRLGGDEFAVLLPDSSCAEGTATRMLDLLAEPMQVDGVSLAVGASVGVACYPGDARGFEELLRRADVAMYQAKAARGSYRRYSCDRDGATVERLSLVAELRAALAEGQLRVHFQPQHDLRTGRLVGAEALVRWEHPERGLLPPNEFVPVLEGSPLVRDLTRQVLDLAVAECEAWRRSGADLTVAVNLSARDLDDPDLADTVRTVLARHGLPADRLVLEITETAVLRSLDAVAEHAARLRELGVVLSIDDFGTGHSSLTILQRIAVQELKIDRSFVTNMLSNCGDATITRATVQLAQGLGLRTVAEGVEDASVLARLQDLRCDAGQGHHWSPAVPAAELRLLLDLEAAATVA